MKRFAFVLLVLGCVAAGLVGTATSPDAASLKTLPSLSLKTLNEEEVRLSDARFKDKAIVLAAFSTWSDASRRQARELQKFHEQHPGVEIVALIVDDVAGARDFRDLEGLKYPCYKSNDGPRVATNLMKLFDSKKNKQVMVSRVPFVIVADKERHVAMAKFGVTDAATLKDKIAALK